MKKIFVYYHPDADGIMSAAIVKYALTLQGFLGEFAFLPFSYYSEPKIDRLSPDWVEGVYVVDASLPPAKANHLREIFGGRFVWIDHHATAIERWQNSGFEQVAGIRSTQESATMLTWYYFFGEQAPIPLSVDYTNRYDMWRKDNDWDTITYPWQIVVMNFMCNFSTFDMSIFTNNAKMFDYIERYAKPVMIYEKRQQDFASGGVIKLLMQIGQERYSILFLNTRAQSSEVLLSYCKGHPTDSVDGFMVGALTDFNTWKMSLYSAPNSSINCKVIAERFGGGGHLNAAGFRIADAYFRRIFENVII